MSEINFAIMLKESQINSLSNFIDKTLDRTPMSAREQIETADIMIDILSQQKELIQKLQTAVHKTHAKEITNNAIKKMRKE